jgi:hypothetical protein
MAGASSGAHGGMRWSEYKSNALARDAYWKQKGKVMAGSKASGVLQKMAKVGRRACSFIHSYVSWCHVRRREAFEVISYAAPAPAEAPPCCTPAACCCPRGSRRGAGTLPGLVLLLPSALQASAVGAGWLPWGTTRNLCRVSGCTSFFTPFTIHPSMTGSSSSTSSCSLRGRQAGGAVVSAGGALACTL